MVIILIASVAAALVIGYWSTKFLGNYGYSKRIENLKKETGVILKNAEIEAESIRKVESD